MEAPCFHPGPSSLPLPCNAAGERTPSRALAADIWCWKTNWVHQHVSDPQEKERQLPFSPLGSSLITDGINPGLMRCRSPADPRMPCRRAGPRLQAGRLVCRLMCPSLLRELVAGLRTAFGLLNTVQHSVHCPCLIPPADGVEVWMEREIFTGMGENRGGKNKHSNKFYICKSSSYATQRLPSGWTLPFPMNCYSSLSMSAGHNQCMFLDAQTFQRWGSEIKLSTLFNTQTTTHPVFQSFDSMRTSHASASSIFSSALRWCPFL